MKTETIVTFPCGHTGTLPVDSAAAQNIMRLQTNFPHWRTLCKSCRPSSRLGEGDHS